MENVTIIAWVVGGFILKYIFDFGIGLFKKPKVEEHKFEAVFSDNEKADHPDDKHFEFYQQMLNKLLEDKLSKKG